VSGLCVDLFAGGGGASEGIRNALGVDVDIAINHDAAAVALHEANHPNTTHYVSDVFEVDPRIATGGKPVGLLWASPDCTYHSKARGSKPIRSKLRKRRALAWVVTRWAGQVRPRVIGLENVEEFAKWGPLVGHPDSLRPCQKRRGKSFRRWVRSLRQLGYAVEWRELRACDYGAPTIRKRFFLIARCDGQPIVWPEPTHGIVESLVPYRTASECIDWSVPMLSIFATKDEAKIWSKFYRVPSPVRPLRDNTMRRIARGVKRFVLDNPKPFIVTLNHGGDWQRAWDIDEPLKTLTSARDAHAVVSPFLATYHDEGRRSSARASELEGPIPTIDCSNRYGLVAAFLAQNNGGFFDGEGRGVDEPVSTILSNSRGHHGLIAAHLHTNNNSRHPHYGADEPAHTIVADGARHNVVAAHIQRDFGTSTGHKADAPLGTITTEGGGKASIVASFLSKYYGTSTGQALDEPLDTVTTKDRFGVVTVAIGGEQFYIDDICMRMLQPRELYLAQGFDADYIIDVGPDGRKLTKTEQVRMVGNSVSPPVAEAIVRANFTHVLQEATA
jgi:DNA (cytosine-5)-methyltransferase 1